MGGAQERFGIRPDLTAVGKIVGGGFPAAAFGGREDIMRQLAPEGAVYQAGTLSGNPVAMAAGLATLKQLAAPGFYTELERRSRRFFDRLRGVIAGRDIRLNHVGTMFTLFFNGEPVRDFAGSKRSDPQRFSVYFNRMLRRGIYVSPSQFEGNFIGACHTPEVLDRVLTAIEESIEGL